MIVAGFGFRTSATLASLQQALEIAEHGHAVTHLATAEDKADTSVFRALVNATGLPLRTVSSAALSGQKTHTRSHAALQARATGSVAEAAALAAAGPGARLLRARVISEDRLATCALAEGANR